MHQPLNRKARLLALLNDGAELSLEDMARELSLTSIRQVRRLIGALQKEGVRIETRRIERIKHFAIAPNARPVMIPTHDITLLEEEALALAVAAEAATAALAPTPLHAPLERAVSRLMELLGPRVLSFESEETPLHWHFDTVVAAAIAPEIFRALMRAIGEMRSVRIDYLTASTGQQWEGRKVDPYAIAVRGSSWLLVARCHIKREILDFSLPGISRVQPCDAAEEGAYFLLPEKFDLTAHFRDRFNALSGREVHLVRLLAEPDRAAYFRRKLYHPTQQIEEEREDGRIVISYEVSGLEEIRSFVQSWGVGVTALEPGELVERLRHEAEELERRYGEIG